MVAGERNDAQSLAQIRELASRLASKNGDAAISSASEPKSPKQDKHQTGGRGNGENGGFKANELEDLKKKGDEYLSTVENEITQAKSVEELMVLVDSVPSKGAKKRLSLKLSNGLPGLLPLDKDFSRKFNGLIDQWEKRIVEVFFDDAHTKHFRSSLRDVLKITPDVDKGMFFSRYLDYFGCSALGDVVPVREKLVALWKEQFSTVMRELKDQKKRERKSATSTLAGKPGNQPPLPGSQLLKSKQRRSRNKSFIPPIDMDDAVRDARDRSENGKHPDQPEMVAWARRHEASGIAGVPAPLDGRPELRDLLQSEARWEEKVGVIRETLRGMRDKISALKNLSEETKMEALKGWMIEQVGKYFQGVSLEQRTAVVELLLEKK